MTKHEAIRCKYDAVIELQNETNSKIEHIYLFYLLGFLDITVLTVYFHNMGFCLDFFPPDTAWAY